MWILWLPITSIFTAPALVLGSCTNEQKLPFNSGKLPTKKFENHHPDTFITTQEHWLLWNGMIPLHEKIHFIFSMTEIKCKLVKFNKCYVKRILLFIVIDLNWKKWWSIDKVSTVWLELFTCSYSCRDNNSVYHLKIMNGTSRSIYNTCLFIIHVAAKMRKYFLYC